MPSHVFDDPKHWLQRTEQARALAKQMSDAASKEMMLGRKTTSGSPSGRSSARKRSERRRNPSRRQSPHRGSVYRSTPAQLLANAAIALRVPVPSPMRRLPV